MIGNSRKASKLLATAAFLAIMAASAPAHAVDKSPIFTFSIERQSLATALTSAVTTAGYQIAIDAELVRNRTAPSLLGSFTIEQALSRLLEGTGLTYSIHNGMVVILRQSNSTRRETVIPVSDNVPSAAPVAENQTVPIEIIVTGSRISRKGYDTPQPVAVIDSKAIEQTGVSNVGDVLNRMPQVGVGLGQANSYYNGDAGAAFINLRGLGTNRTLVLVNGRRRVSGTELSSAVDLTTIPANMIEKVEVITGGAAAVYGADAVTGVVNVTLKSHVKGFELSGRSGISDKGDAGSYSLGGTWGASFDEDRGSFVVGASYNHEGLLIANQRGFGRNQVELFANPANTGPADGIFDSIAVSNYRYPGTSYGGTFTIGGTPYTYGTRGVRPLQNSQRVSYWGVGGDGFNDADFAPLRNRADVFAGSLHFDYAFSPAVQFYVDGQYAKTKTLAPLQPTFDLGITLTNANPLIPADVRALMTAAGETTVTIGRTNVDQGINIRHVDRDTATGVTGFKGEFGAFHWNAFYQYGRYQADTDRTHNRITANFNQAVDAIAGPNGPICSDPAARAAGCVPLNLFGPTAATPAALAYFDYTSHRKVVNTQQVAGLQLDGEALHLPAGPVRVAIGAEWRKETTAVTPDPLQAAGKLLFLTDGAIDASYNVKEVFGEILVPVLTNRPGFHELSLEGAIRRSDYSTIGTTTTWKLGGVWAPTSDVRLRVTRSRSVRAPNLSELYNPGSSSNLFILDPCDASRINLGPNRQANCAALGIPTGWTDPTTGVFKTILTSGNPNLGAETSNSWTAGLVLTPSFLRGLSASIDWWQIGLRGAVGTVPVVRAVDNCVDASTINNPFCSLVQRGANSAISQVNVSPINVGSLDAEGIDFAANWRHNYGSFAARLGVAGTYLITNELEVVAGDPTTLDIQRGEIDNPIWRFNVTPGFTVGRFSLDWTMRYVRNTKVDVQASAEARSDNNVASRLYNDLYASMEITDRFKLYAGVNNLFDVTPPFSRETFQGTGRGAMFDNIGRYLYVGVNTTF